MIAVYVLFAIFGLCIGSFLNVVIYRLPNGMSLSFPPSHCTKCDYKLRWYDNVPILSYLFLGGKCRKCKEKISFRYPAVECLCGVLYLISAMLFYKKSIAYAVVCALALSVLICVFFIDLEHMYVPDRFQVILLVLGIVAMFFDEVVWWEHLLGGALGGGLFLIIYLGAIVFLKKVGLGFGDVKLAFVCGVLLGWKKIFLAIIIASLSACIVIIPKSRKGEQKEFPFAPYIALGVAVALLIGEFIIKWYLGLMVV